MRINIFTASDYNKFTNEILGAKIKSKKLFNASDTSEFIKNTDWDGKVKILTANVELKAEQDKMVKLNLFDLTYFRGKSHFEDDGIQNYLVFQSVQRCFKQIGNSK